MVEPRVTVGLPLSGDADGLRRSVPTVFGQTWGGPLRLLVVDDTSTDETQVVLEQLATVYEGIEVVRSDQNEGRPAARSKIVQLAGDDYLAWIEAGDLWHPRKLEVQLDALFGAERERPDEPLLCVGPFRCSFADRDEERIRVPDVDGDQLYNALTGTLFPYLQAIVGRAELFRRLGAFDLRLECRQDYDFLVRFLGEGGRVVRPREEVPLFTYLNSEGGRSAKDVAAANRVLRHTHRAYYDRYRALARRVRGKQHKLVARFYRHNGEHVRSLGYEMLASLADPVQFGSRTARRFQPSRMARAVARFPAKAVRPALPFLQRTEVKELVRKAGIIKVVSRAGLAGGFLPTLMSEVEDTSGSSPYPATRSGELPADALRIEQDIGEAESSVPADTWLRLEAAYRKHSLLHSAESALRRGLNQHPASVELRVRLVELLWLRKKWGDCVELWSGGAGLHARVLRGLTYARVARSLRELGEFHRANQVAEDGARRWPEDSHIAEELYVSRAGLTDWKHVVRRSDDRIVEEVEATGVVTDLGFLAGSDGPLRGKVNADGSRTVSLLVNGHHVATTHAASGETDGMWAWFSLSCHELLRYLGDGDTVWVECDGRRLAIAGGGTTCTVETDYPSRMRELERQLAMSYVFTKRGALRKGNSPRRRKHTLALFDEVSSLIAESHGYPTYPFYGHLLGAVREHDFIEHDAGGFDMGYVSQHSAPDDVRTEFMEILRMLLARGYHLRLEPWSTYIRTDRRSRVFVDLNHAWFNSNGGLSFSFGWRHQQVTDRDRFYMPRESLIGNRLIRVPGNAEEVLEQVYGPTWAVPDQGFVLEADVRRDERYLLALDEMRAIEQLDPDRIEALYDHHPDADD